MLSGEPDLSLSPPLQRLRLSPMEALEESPLDEEVDGNLDVHGLDLWYDPECDYELDDEE